LPGPGPETAIQKFCGAEYERVLAIALRTIRDSTAIEDERAEALARKIAAAHADALYLRLEGPSAGAKAPAAPRKQRGMQGTARARALEMHRDTAHATMEA
jgi:hypothetical protein